MSVSPTVLRRLMRELNELQMNPPEGIRVVTSEDNMLDVTGIVEGPEGTPYTGGYFRVKFSFTEEFPAAPPKCRMITKIFHPNVSAAGEICVNTLKKDWKSSYGIGHILVTVKCLLIHPNPESALDEEAGKLLLENYDSYCDRARLITSVHATPRVRPTEFDKPAASTCATTSASKSASTKSLSSSASVSAATENSAPVAYPLHASTPNTCTLSPSDSSLSSEKRTGKDRLTSPAPLGTADSNVAGTTAAVPAAATTSTKAVKRAATGGGSGAEKRKKALKRL
ncbi:hypothetical protein DAEQUDRAFT_731849 [Daedalea quercina L-15889]|uniref:E2 ubiquitin-conjugating enzyme n=1 Tax=Daedalea quercina L-15889 TaxID=1314783 RepID=A0A165M1B3_9APHY|nr:hypothetical protein DAEQUDRAFT_731849 [Daedalea quercina L-15889]